MTFPNSLTRFLPLPPAVPAITGQDTDPLTVADPLFDAERTPDRAASPVVRQAINPEVLRFMRFAAVGGIGTVVDFSALILLKEAIGLPLLLANSLSYLAGVGNNFTLNRAWTYPEARHKALWRQFIQFLLISTAGLLLNSLIVNLLAEPLGTLLNLPDTGYLAAKVLATGLVVFWNFTANRLWTFG